MNATMSKPAKLEKLQAQDVQDLPDTWLEQLKRVRPRKDLYREVEVNGRHFDGLFERIWAGQLAHRANGLYSLKVRTIKEGDKQDAMVLRASNGVEWHIYFTRKQGRPPKALDY